MITLLAGNGRVLLTLDADGRWNNLFYPHPGEFNHLREMRLGLFDVQSGRFWWLGGDAGLAVRQDHDGDSSTAVTRWDGGAFVVTATDDVHPNHDLVVRNVRIESDQPRDLRLFAYHSFTIAESMFQDTAFLDRAQRSLVHYKRHFYFELFGDPPFDAVVCGEHTLKGLRGTYVDAEDGRLEGGTISHGAADSVLQWNVAARPGHPAHVRLFLAIGRSREETDRLRATVRTGDVARFERESTMFARNWIAHRRFRVPDELGEAARALYVRSFFVMRHGASLDGAIIASPDTRTLRQGGDTYNYCWGRDGGYISMAMDDVGLHETAHRFLRFCARVQSPDGGFVHRHFPDGTMGSTWHPPPFLQVDQTGTILTALWHHFKRHGDLDTLLELWPLVRGAANFLCDFRDPATGLPKPSFDLWEERLGVHTYSTAVVCHALERSARIAEELGKDPERWRTASREMQASAVEQFWNPARGAFVRSLWPRDDKLDASILLALRQGLVPWDDRRARMTVDRIEERLTRPGGGVARYEDDWYFGHENPWIITTLWLADARLRLGDVDAARRLIRWCVDRRTPTGLLSEQVDPSDGSPKSAVPLLWSHSTFVDLVNHYRRVAAGGEAA